MSSTRRDCLKARADDGRPDDAGVAPGGLQFHVAVRRGATRPDLARGVAGGDPLVSVPTSCLHDGVVEQGDATARPTW
jgi:hypothetical protein